MNQVPSDLVKRVFVTSVILSLALLLPLTGRELLPTRRDQAEWLWPIFGFFTQHLNVLLWIIYNLQSIPPISWSSSHHGNQLQRS